MLISLSYQHDSSIAPVLPQAGLLSAASLPVVGCNDPALAGSMLDSSKPCSTASMGSSSQSTVADDKEGGRYTDEVDELRRSSPPLSQISSASSEAS